MSTSLTITFRTADEATSCDLTRIGNVVAGSTDGLTVRLEDVSVDDFRDDRDTSDVPAALRAAFAAAGLWPAVVEVE